MLQFKTQEGVMKYIDSCNLTDLYNFIFNPFTKLPVSIPEIGKSVYKFNKINQKEINIINNDIDRLKGMSRYDGKRFLPILTYEIVTLP